MICVGNPRIANFSLRISKTLIQYAVLGLVFNSLEPPSLWTEMMPILAQSSWAKDEGVLPLERAFML
jgi:hypothetical protein